MNNEVEMAPMVHGKWLYPTDKPTTISARCSCCAWKAHLYEDDVAGMPYCPNCGAKMDLE